MNKPKKLHSRFTGEQIGRILKQQNVNLDEFCRETGFDRSRLGRLLKGELDGDIPRWFDRVLWSFYVDVRKDPPFEELVDHGLRSRKQEGAPTSIEGATPANPFGDDLP